MIRKAFLMRVHPGRIAEYTLRHQPIWAELAAVLKEHGVSEYSIFHDPETDQLFGYALITSEAQWAAIASTPVCQRWWRFMSDIMPSNPDSSPVARELKEVFYLK